jgi:hypothetical protein
MLSKRQIKSLLGKQNKLLLIKKIKGKKKTTKEIIRELTLKTATINQLKLESEKIKQK